MDRCHAVRRVCLSNVRVCVRGLRGSNMRDDKLASGGWVSMGMLHPQQSIPIVHKNTQRNEVVKQMETASLWCAHSERVSSSSCTLELAQHCKLQLHTKGREKMISYANAAEGGWGAYRVRRPGISRQHASPTNPTAGHDGCLAHTHTHTHELRLSPCSRCRTRGKLRVRPHEILGRSGDTNTPTYKQSYTSKQRADIAIRSGAVSAF